MKIIARRIHGICSLLLLLALTIALFPQTAKSRVVLARNPRTINERNEGNAAEMFRLFDQALLALTGAGNAAAAWQRLGLTPTDVVAVKINCNNWTITLSPTPELVNALCRSLMSVIPANQIIIYDNEASAVSDSGFTLNNTAAGVRKVGTDQGFGFDEKERLTRLLTQTASKIINMPSLKAIDPMGVSVFFKNHIGSLIPEDMPKCHDSQEFLASVLAKPSIRKKTILNLCSALRGSYRRGVPWYWGGIIMSLDPVAAETAAIGVINEKRAQEKLAPLPLPESLKIAETKLGLGTTAPGKTDLIRIEL